MKEIIDIYKELFDCSDILNVLSKYIAYSEYGFLYDFGSTILKKGTKLYRIRRYSTADFSNQDEWKPAPLRPQNRCNYAGQTALYLGSDENVCILETHINKGEKYVLGEYEVLNDINIGGYTYAEPDESKWKIFAGMLFNNFLIAPSRNEHNKELFNILDSYFSDVDYSDIKLSALTSPEEGKKLSWRIGHINKSDKYYEITNKMCTILRKQYPKGIRYSSCFFPIETVGIECSMYNICLYESALDDIKYISHNIKTNNREITSAEIAKVILNHK